MATSATLEFRVQNMSPINFYDSNDPILSRLAVDIFLTSLSAMGGVCVVFNEVQTQ